MSSIRRDDIDKFFDYDLHVPTRTIYMGDECNELMAELCLKGMTLLEAANSDPINIVMNNIGGDEYHGLGIYDKIATSKCFVKITAYGHAMSMGSWIMQAADSRVMAPNCTMMIHYGSWSMSDAVKYVRVLNKEMERLNLLMEAAYLGRMKAVDPQFSLRKLRKMLEDEVYLTAEQAVEIGLADHVLGQE